MVQNRVYVCNQQQAQQNLSIFFINQFSGLLCPYKQIKIPVFFTKAPEIWNMVCLLICPRLSKEILVTQCVSFDARRQVSFWVTFPRRCWVMASMAVICARIKADVNITSTGMLLILFPASIASSIPFLLRGTSTHPVNKFFSFHNDSPCRIRIKAASSKLLTTVFSRQKLRKY